MTNFKYSTNITQSKFDLILVIILSLMIVIVIGYNITKFFDLTLNENMSNDKNVRIEINNINNINKKNLTNRNNQIKLIDVVSVEKLNNEKDNELGNEIVNEIVNDENGTNKSQYDESEYKETFGNLKDYPDEYSKETTHIMSGVINSDLSNKYIGLPDKYSQKTNPNYNTVNNPPILFSPDTDVPNKADSLKGPNANGYYFSKVKLIENPNSPLMKLYKKNLNQINKMIAQCTLGDAKKIPKINGPYDGYNAYVDLKTDSFANVSSIGKSMLTPFISYPVPS